MIRVSDPFTLTPVSLPPAGLLDQMKADGTLNGTLFTSVGYGTQEPQQAPGGVQNAFDGQRRFAVGEFEALNPTYRASRRTSMREAAGRAAATPAGRSSSALVRMRRTRW